MILNLIELNSKYSMKIHGLIHIRAHLGDQHQRYK